MPSLADIPMYLRPITARGPFVQWLQQSHVDRSTGKHLLFLWSINNGYKWSHSQVIAAIGPE